ncbi:MAG: DUF302 domain-containing protein [Gammaproteobacteria bacterium]|nr:DUF302 domain-containing protein [Gammaproteobacteria bacterium]MCK5262035.1 DUF302 domain-containing protein [Gammaproteobacteria bacterium]
MKNKIENNGIGRWVKKALCGGAVLGLAMTMGAGSALAAGQGSSNGAQSHGFGSMTPFSRVAKVPVVKVQGQIDYKATYAKARAASLAIATYVARTVEADLLGSDVIKGIDWKLGGTSKHCLDNPTLDGACSDEEISHNVLMIPSPDPIDPTDATYVETGVVTKPNTKKGNVIEFCNKKYASMAMGVAPIIADKPVVNGWAHAPALPCEVSVWNDDQHIYVDMLDPSAIFTLFFSDVLFSADMQDPAFAEALYAMPPQVKGEIVAIIHAALADFDPDTKAMDQKIGPVYNSIEDIIKVVDASPLDSPYLHMIYTKQDGGSFTQTESKTVAQTIINTMSKHGDPDAGTHPTVINEDGDTLDSILSPKSSWRSARIAPITIPGKNHIIEACSPKYAKMAMGTGLHHVNALPCEITVKLLSNGSLAISYLDPAFMLGAMFADVEMTDDERAEFFAITGKINTDLQNIVKVALDVNLGIALNAPTRKVINMLP